MVWNDAFEADVWPLEAKARYHAFLLDFDVDRTRLNGIFTTLPTSILHLKVRHTMEETSVIGSRDRDRFLCSITTVFLRFKNIMNPNSVLLWLETELHIDLKFISAVFGMKYFELLIILLTN